MTRRMSTSEVQHDMFATSKFESVSQMSAAGIVELSFRFPELQAFEEASTIRAVVILLLAACTN